MNQQLIEVARILKHAMLDNADRSADVAVFLCGGSAKEEHRLLRREVGRTLSELRSPYRYSIHYPEDMFIEIMLGHQKRDLLALENLLAESVNAVVILLQSSGTIAELGAFSNHDLLRKKLIVIIDPRYKGGRSFINLGPIRYLESLGGRRVLYQRLQMDNIPVLVREVARSAREISKDFDVVRDLTNPIAAYDYYLALIYIFDSIMQEDLYKLAVALILPKNQEMEHRVTTVVATVINTLVTERKIALNDGRLSTTPRGHEILLQIGKTKKASGTLLRLLSDLRIRVINLTLRKNRRTEG